MARSLDLTAETDDRFTNDGLALRLESDDLYRAKSALFGRRALDLRARIPCGRAVESATVRLPLGDWFEVAEACKDEAADARADDRGATARRYDDLRLAIASELVLTDDSFDDYAAETFDAVTA